DLLGAIGLGGVEKVDAEVDGCPHDRHAVVDAGAAAQAEAGVGAATGARAASGRGARSEAVVAAATEPSDADREAGLSQWPVFHHAFLLSCLWTCSAPCRRPTRRTTAQGTRNRRSVQAAGTSLARRADPVASGLPAPGSRPRRPAAGRRSAPAGTRPRRY